MLDDDTRGSHALCQVRPPTTTRARRRRTRSTVCNARALCRLPSAGVGLTNIGQQIEQAVSSSHTKGRVASSIKDMFSAGMYASGRMMLLEFGNILGQITDMIAEVALEIPRLLASIIAGIAKGIGLMLIKGLITSITLGSKALATAFGGILTGLIGTVVTAGVGVAFAIGSILKDLMQMITNLLESIASIIQSVIKIVIPITWIYPHVFGSLLK